MTTGSSSVRRRRVRRDNFSPRKRRDAKTYPWWRVMCLSGVDYFSTLGYQPGIAVAAAGALAPVATGVLVLVTLCGVVPVYRAVAQRSPFGMGSISLAESLVHGWKGKFMVLVLLGFAMTDFVITMTLSAADASAHLLGSSSSPWQLWVTLALLGLLAAVFFRGFDEAVFVAGVLVVAYLALTATVLVAGVNTLAHHPEALVQWHLALAQRGGNPWLLIAMAVIVFPKLALGMSGFEAGVSVIPLIRADGLDQRVARGKRLLLTSACLMSALLLISSLVVTVLVPAAELEPGGAANGRALAWLAETELGSGFGRTYDAATVAILWFAGASAMSGLLALLPRYLPRYGMAPDWAQRSRPMVGVISLVAVAVTLVFHADVDHQAGAYATGVLVLLASGGVAMAVLERGSRRVAFSVTSLILVATLVANVFERPEGLRVAAWFILAVVTASLASRAWRAFDLRTVDVSLDKSAQAILNAQRGASSLALVPAVARSDMGAKERHIRRINHLDTESLIFVEITLRDPSEFAAPMRITGTCHDEVPVLAVEASSIPHALAVIALRAQEETGIVPDVYFEWSPGNPLREMLRFIFVGDGQNATVVHEILRRAIPEETRRPRIHLG